MGPARVCVLVSRARYFSGSLSRSGVHYSRQRELADFVDDLLRRESTADVVREQSMRVSKDFIGAPSLWFELDFRLETAKVEDGFYAGTSCWFASAVRVVKPVSL